MRQSLKNSLPLDPNLQHLVVAAARAALCDQSCHQLFAACEQQVESILDPVQLIWPVHEDPSPMQTRSLLGFLPDAVLPSQQASGWLNPHPEDESLQAEACC